jgi:hypothetical protein
MLPGTRATQGVSRPSAKRAAPSVSAMDSSTW